MGKKEIAQDGKKASIIPYIVTTGIVYFGNMSYGCAINAFSPALTDFKNKYDTDTSTISVVFVAAVGCYMVGALSCTLLYSFINRQLCVVFLFSGMTLSMMLSPHVPSLNLFYVVGGLLGFCVGCYDVAQIVWIMEMWQSKSGPFIQAQYFCYGIGTVLAPVIISPFLKNKFEDEEEDADEKNSRLFIPFTIIGCLCAITAISQLFLFIFMRYKPPPPESNEPVQEKERKLDQLFGNVRWPTIRLIILTALSLGFYQGMEMCTLQLFPTFGQRSSLELTEAEAANTLTGLTLAFTLGRGLGIFLVLKIPPHFICCVNLALLTAGNVILIAWGQKYVSMLWTAAILYGSGLSSFLPSFAAFMERFLVFTDAVGAIMIVTGSIVGAVYPLVVGMFIDDTPVVFAFPIFISIGVVTCSSILAYVVTRGMTKRINE